MNTFTPPQTAVLTRPIISKASGATLPPGEKVTIIHVYPAGNGGEILLSDGEVWGISGPTLNSLQETANE